MREFSQIFTVRILTTVTPWSSTVRTIQMISDDPISYSERTRSSDAGITYEQSARVYVDRDDYDELMIYVPKTMAQVALSDCDSTYLWGDEELPVTMTITPHLNKYILELSRNSASSLFKK